MRNNLRLKAILAAGALTGLILATVIAFAWPSSGEADAADPATAVPASPAEQLQAENAQLRNTVEQLQQREAAYQSQLESANQTILQMQGDNAQLQAPQNAPRQGDDDEHEYEHEEREHEHEAYGEYAEVEFDD